MAQAIPPELWIQIIRELPSYYQRSCLSVSKLFHDISLQYVFVTINVRLGLLKDHYLAGNYEWRALENEEKVEAEAAIRRSCELLRHIVCSPNSGLAQAVRDVSVRAYSYEGESPSAELLDALEEALTVLRLRAFAWYGCHPMPRQQLFESFFTTSGEILEDIVLPTELELVDHTSVRMFTRLKSLSFLNRYGDRYRRLEEEDPHFDSMRQMVTEVSLSLRSLGTFGEVLWKCNVQRFSALVELTLVLHADIDAIETIFTHSSQLRSLTLYVGALYFGDLASVLRAHPNALPLLTAFRLSYPDIERDHSEAMAAFLRMKPLLERLDVGHNRFTPAFDEIQPVLEILRELPRLRTLGYGLISDWDSPGLTRDTLLHLSRYIPPGLIALSLWVSADAGQTSAITEADWIQFFSGLQSCRFIYVAMESTYSGELHSALLDHPPPSAELVGFNEDFAWVERELETGRAAYGTCWPVSKAYYRTAEEFGCEEWQWLLKDLELRRMLW